MRLSIAAALAATLHARVLLLANAAEGRAKAQAIYLRGAGRRWATVEAVPFVQAVVTAAGMDARDPAVALGTWLGVRGDLSFVEATMEEVVALSPGAFAMLAPEAQRVIVAKLDEEIARVGVEHAAHLLGFRRALVQQVAMNDGTFYDPTDVLFAPGTVYGAENLAYLLGAPKDKRALAFLKDTKSPRELLTKLFSAKTHSAAVVPKANVPRAISMATRFLNLMQRIVAVLFRALDALQDVNVGAGALGFAARSAAPATAGADPRLGPKVCHEIVETLWFQNKAPSGPAAFEGTAIRVGTEALASIPLATELPGVWDPSMSVASAPKVSVVAAGRRDGRGGVVAVSSAAATPYVFNAATKTRVAVDTLPSPSKASPKTASPDASESESVDETSASSLKPVLVKNSKGKKEDERDEEAIEANNALDVDENRVIIVQNNVVQVVVPALGDSGTRVTPEDPAFDHSTAQLETRVEMDRADACALYSALAQQRMVEAMVSEARARGRKVAHYVYHAPENKCVPLGAAVAPSVAKTLLPASSASTRGTGTGGVVLGEDGAPWVYSAGAAADASASPSAEDIEPDSKETGTESTPATATDASNATLPKGGHVAASLKSGEDASRYVFRHNPAAIVSSPLVVEDAEMISVPVDDAKDDHGDEVVEEEDGKTDDATTSKRSVKFEGDETSSESTSTNISSGSRSSCSSTSSDDNVFPIDPKKLVDIPEGTRAKQIYVYDSRKKTVTNLKDAGMTIDEIGAEMHEMHYGSKSKHSKKHGKKHSKKHGKKHSKKHDKE